jgi:hypothetical protein
MYLTGSFFIALSILAATMVTNVNSIPAGLGEKTPEQIINENKNLKIAVLFLLITSIIILFVKFKGQKTV